MTKNIDDHLSEKELSYVRNEVRYKPKNSLRKGAAYKTNTGGDIYELIKRTGSRKRGIESIIKNVLNSALMLQKQYNGNKYEIVVSNPQQNIYSEEESISLGMFGIYLTKKYKDRF